MGENEQAVSDIDIAGDVSGYSADTVSDEPRVSDWRVFPTTSKEQAD